MYNQTSRALYRVLVVQGPQILRNKEPSSCTKSYWCAIYDAFLPIVAISRQNKIQTSLITPRVWPGQGKRNWLCMLRFRRTSSKGRKIIVG